MLVEHRCGARTAILFEATIRSPTRGSLTCRVRNLCAGGMFVEFPGRLLAPCAVVEVLFRLPLAGARSRVARILRWSAMVVHRQGAGMGLMFDQFHAREVAAILAAQRAIADTPAPARKQPRRTAIAAGPGGVRPATVEEIAVPPAA